LTFRGFAAGNADTEFETREMEVAARTLGLRAIVAKSSDPREIDVAFGGMLGQRMGALIVGSDALFTTQRDQLVALAARYSIPTVYPYREHVVAGGLASYGTDILDGWRQTGVYTGRIIKGEKPSDLPVQQVTKVELVINITTAKALGLTFPLTLLGRADVVIE
jgi:putative tryptophan/tyrosine transport system substrate-binding protein